MRIRKRKGGEDVTARILADAKMEAAQIIQNEFDYASAVTESPIERIFLAQLLHPSTARTYDTRLETMLPKSGMVANAVPPPFPGIYVYPQIRIGDFRVDFLLAYVGRSVAPLIVECDGHDFHEKTKEQAQRDKARDRYLVSQGYRLVRFTGSEIYQNPEGAVEEAISILLDLNA